jgi:hypothetical protein
MSESRACRICGISPEILWDHPELAARCVRVQFRPDDSYGGAQAAWFCDTHAWVGLKYAGQPAGLAWLSILTTVGLYRRAWPRERGLGADQR